MSRLRTTKVNLLRTVVLTIAIFLTASSLATSQIRYPLRRILLVVPYSAGGGTDLIARAFVEAIRQWLPVPVTVLNLPAASGAEGERFVAKAIPDGYVLGFGTTGSVLTLPMIQGDVGYTWESFEPIAILTKPSFVIVCNVKSPWKAWAELLAFMKANPGKVTYANSGLGGSAQFAAELLSKKLGFKWTPVPFQGSAPAIQAVMAGSVDVGVPSTGSAIPLLGTGKLRFLAITAPKRIPQLPDVPTFKELGYDFEFIIWRMLHAPKGTPEVVLEYWEDMVKKALRQPTFVEELTKIEGEPPDFEGRAQAKARLKREYAQLKPVADLIRVSR
jgi:tripartite-type tricarboxylate transporter receptor subunit TctC